MSMVDIDNDHDDHDDDHDDHNDHDHHDQFMMTINQQCIAMVALLISLVAMIIK